MASNDNPWGGSTAVYQPDRLGGSANKPSKFDRTKEVASVGFEKTKVVASVGFEKSKVVAKKVKQGASVGANWIKLKYQKSKLFQKK